MLLTLIWPFTFISLYYTFMEKEMATHSSVLAWRIPGTEEPGGLPFVGLHRFGHNWSDLAAAAALYFQMFMCYDLISFYFALKNSF